MVASRLVARLSLFAFLILTIASSVRAQPRMTASEEETQKYLDVYLAHDQRKDALEAYDSFRKNSGRDSALLLASIARSELRALSHGELSSLQGEALGTLAANGDVIARKQLEQMAGTAPITTPTAAAATEALARLDDARAAQRLVAWTAQMDPGQRVMLLRALGSVPHAPALALIRDSLASSNPLTQAAAAESAAALGLKETEPDLRKVLASGHPFAQNAATLALARMGDPAAKERARKMLTSPAPPVRLQAARALDQIGDRSWVADIQPLLKDPDGLTRFQAAELLLHVDRPAALAVLQPGLADPNPAIRGECARILTADAAADLPALRTLLGDAASQIRLQAAAAILAKARVATPAAAPAAAAPKKR
jgi:HEAT repeat protein